MKKSNKIPKTHLPKYTRGGSSRAGVDSTRSMYDTYESPTFGDSTSSNSGSDATTSFYNDKRAKNNNYDQYAQYGQVALNTGTQLSANKSLSGQDKAQADYNAVNSGINSVAGAMTPWYGYAKGASDMGRGMIARDENGKPVDKTNAQMDAVMKPHHEMITEDLSKGNTGLAIAELLLPGIGIESRSNALGMSKTINNTFGVKNDQYMYAHGGVSQAPNAEIEKQENVVAPNGGFLQANGPSHEGGGVPVALPGNSMIFSDRLKLGKKTFAELNKANNTNKEDRILESNKYGSTSKSTAELMKMAKNKNSEALFNIQESLKKAKVEAYAKKMGVTLPQEEQPTEFPMGGVKLPMYPYGGPTDNTKFTPAQRQQAYNDSLTLYKSGFNKNVPNWKTPGFNEAVGRLTELNGVAPQSTDRSATAYANDVNYLAQRSVPYAKPTAPVINTEVKKPTTPVYSNVNMPMKGLESNEPSINPQLQAVPANRPSTIKTNIVTGPNMSYKEYKQGNEVLDRMYFDPQTKKEIELTGFKYGGKLPKYEFGKLTPEEEGGDIESVWNNSSAKIDAQHGWNSNDETTRPGYKRQTDWQGIGSNIAMGLANNAGNIYNLSRYNKPEIEKYERMKATYLDPTAAIRDAEMQNRRAEYNVRGASGGNAGTYLSNRVALNAQNTMNKARIHKEFENANAGISNSVNQYNNELARQEVIANAQNRARNRSGKGEAIGSMGSNIANQMMDNKKTNMDQETLGLLMKYYDTPEFQRIMKEYKGKK